VALRGYLIDPGKILIQKEMMSILQTRGSFTIGN
jgi:hypothetical protein